VVGGWLNLPSLTSIPNGFNPVVGGSLWLTSLTSIPKGFNPVVGGWLNLPSLTSIPNGFNPVVGGSLNLKDGLSCPTRKPTFPISWQDGKYLLIDGVLTEILSKHRNYYKGKIVGKKDVCYVATNGESWAHGKTLREASKDLMFKGSKRAVELYKGMDKEKKLNFSEAVACYRSITGACSFGVKNFVESIGLDVEKKYSVKDMLKLSEGKYGSETFKEFFA
jgi:hypothetical protein